MILLCVFLLVGLLCKPAVAQLEKDAKHALVYQLLKIFLTQGWCLLGFSLFHCCWKAIDHLVSLTKFLSFVVVYVIFWDRYLQMNLSGASLIDKVHKYNTQFLLGIPDCNICLEFLYNDAMMHWIVSFFFLFFLFFF